MLFLARLKEYIIAHDPAALEKQNGLRQTTLFESQKRRMSVEDFLDIEAKETKPGRERIYEGDDEEDNSSSVFDSTTSPSSKATTSESESEYESIVSDE